jgi:hypothetical protein
VAPTSRSSPRSRSSPPTAPNPLTAPCCWLLQPRSRLTHPRSTPEPDTDSTPPSSSPAASSAGPSPAPQLGCLPPLQPALRQAAPGQRRVVPWPNPYLAMSAPSGTSSGSSSPLRRSRSL